MYADHREQTRDGNPGADAARARRGVIAQVGASEYADLASTGSYPRVVSKKRPISRDFTRNVVTVRVYIDVRAELRARFRDWMNRRSRRRIPDSQLHQLVRRLLRSNQPGTDTPIIISPLEGKYFSSVGRLLERSQGRVSALVDHALERDRAVTVFLPENAYVAEVVNCLAEGQQFTVELVLIQYQDT